MSLKLPRWVLHNVDCHNHTSTHHVAKRHYENAMNNTFTFQVPHVVIMQTALRAAHSSAGWLTALRQTQRELVFTSPLIHRSVDLKDSSSFISNTLNRSHLNLRTRRPVKHDTGSSYRTKNHKTTFTTLCNWVTCVAWLLELLNFTSGTLLVSWFPVLWRAPPTAKPHWSKTC